MSLDNRIYYSRLDFFEGAIVKEKDGGSQGTFQKMKARSEAFKCSVKQENNTKTVASNFKRMSCEERFECPRTTTFTGLVMMQTEFIQNKAGNLKFLSYSNYHYVVLIAGTVLCTP